MGTTAARKLNYATISNFDVTAGQTVTTGFAVTMDSDTTVRNAAAASDLIIGIAHTGGTSTVAGDTNVDVFLFNPVVMVVQGTGNATRGNKATWVVDGFIDANAVDPAGTTSEPTYGVFLQSGAAQGDHVGMIMAVANRITA